MVSIALLHSFTLSIIVAKAVGDSFSESGAAGVQKAHASRGGIGHQGSFQVVQVKGELQSCAQASLCQNGLNLLMPFHHCLLHHHTHHLHTPLLLGACAKIRNFCQQHHAASLAADALMRLLLWLCMRSNREQGLRQASKSKISVAGRVIWWGSSITPCLAMSYLQ